MTPPPWAPWHPPAPLLSEPPLAKHVSRVFGDPGTPERPNGTWKHAHIIDVRDLPGVPPKFYVEIHRAVEPHAREALRRAQLSAPGYAIERLGCFVLRHQRHDPHLPLSRHSWGIALDINAADNGARSFASGTTPAPWSPRWMRWWPQGIPEAFVLAMESCGWRWGGRWKAFVDPMHFEYVA